MSMRLYLLIDLYFFTHQCRPETNSCDECDLHSETDNQSVAGHCRGTSRKNNQIKNGRWGLLKRGGPYLKQIKMSRSGAGYDDDDDF